MQETNKDPSKAVRIKSSNLLYTLWRGKAPLVITYWIFGVLGCLALALLAKEISTEANGIIFKLIALPILVLYQVFISVSIWRSSDNYKRIKFCAILAKVAVIIGVITSIPRYILWFIS